MAPKIEDHWLWLGLGVFTFVAIRTVSAGLTSIVHLTTVHNPSPHPPTPPLINIGKEDAIKTSSLETLALCSNVEIRKAATKILCERFFAHHASRCRLFNELSSRNKKVQHRARLAFKLLCDHDVVQEVVLPPTPRALRSSREQGRRRLDAGWAEGGVERREGGDSVEDRERRRRNREAMVLHEGDRPVSREDVWMRDGEGRMSTEEGLHALI